MKIYDTYQEAKIANPDCQVITTSENWDGDFALIGRFRCIDSKGDLIGLTGAPRLSDDAWKICNPANYCMTVEKFLADGYKFIDGDLLLGIGGNFVTVGIDYSAHLSNVISISDNKRYILRAAALEEKTISVDEEPPRTKVEYVKCEFKSRGEALDCFDNNEELYEPSCNPEGYSLCEDPYNVIDMWDQLYRRIETPITEREAFIDTYAWAVQDNKSNVEDIAGMLYNSGKFKLVN